jgi:hypothetical protein
LKTNLNILLDFLDKMKSNDSMKFITSPDIGNILALLNTEEYYIYCLYHGQNKLAYYFFKNSRIIYDDVNENSSNTLQFIGSFCNTKSIYIFDLGFKYALNSIRKIINFNMMLFENLSHNHFLLGKFNNSNQIVLKYESAYYLYNYVIQNMPLNANKCLMLV